MSIRSVHINAFEFNYVPLKNISRLAWLAHIRKDNNSIDIFCGPWVETKKNFFVEGAWDGEFLKGRFDNAISSFGSGGLLIPSSVIFSSPTHCREKLFLIKHDNAIYVSNSIVYLLCRSGDSIDPSYNYYEDDLKTIQLGIKDYIKRIPLKTGNTIHLYYHCNVEVKPDLSIGECKKNDVNQEFSDYLSYKTFLERSILNIFNNATDPNRNIKYRPLATTSTGYDSVCCSVLAKRSGCKEALTYVTNNDRSDSGAKIAELLGMSIYEIDRMEYLKSDRQFIEAEIFSAGFRTQDTNILSFEKYLGSRMLITGFQGDKVWEKNSDKVNSNIEIGSSGVAYTEFRLRVGFIHFIVPHLGATRFPSIYRISNSEEMRTWSSAASNYDRPIPVRITMEENIPRSLFGILKLGSGVYPARTIMSRFIEKPVRNNVIFKSFYKSLSPGAVKRIRRIKAVSKNITENLVPFKIKHKKEYRRYRNVLKDDSLKDLFNLYTESKNSSFSTLRFLWGIERTKHNYKEEDQI